MYDYVLNEYIWKVLPSSVDLNKKGSRRHGPTFPDDSQMETSTGPIRLDLIYTKMQTPVGSKLELIKKR